MALNGNGFNPEFSIRMEGRAYARYLGPRDPNSIRDLFEWCKREKVRGQLQINFTGNGGVTDIILDEKRRMTETKEDLPY